MRACPMICSSSSSSVVFALHDGAMPITLLSLCVACPSAACNQCLACLMLVYITPVQESKLQFLVCV